MSFTQSDLALNDLYLQLVDGSGKTMGCNDITSSLAGKTYGLPNASGQTAKITLDLSKLDVADGFDMANVTALRFGCDSAGKITLSNITFEPKARNDISIGFGTPQEAIPDYGSVNSKRLENAVGAVYTSSVNDTAYVVDGNGNFVLQNGETASFYDQFRRGSYIHLEEALTDAEKELYETSWTMYERTQKEYEPITSFAAAQKVANGSISSMVNRTELYVSDGRTEQDGTSVSNPGNSFVFRSYETPDSDKMAPKLKVVFNNKVIILFEIMPAYEFCYEN